MSETIDITGTSSPPATKRANKPEKAKGALSRFLFTLAITTAICLAIMSFLLILGRTTNESTIVMNIEQRSAEQIYAQALEIPEKSLRLRALRNYLSAYPVKAMQTDVQTRIDTLEAEEYEQWLKLSDLFYTASTRQTEKLEAIETFEALWGAGTYHTELASMRGTLEQTPVERVATKPSTPPKPAQEPITQEQAPPLYEDLMAGGPPKIEIYQPATLLPTPAPKPVIVAAMIKDDVEPSYPSRARSREIEAVVTIAMDIGADGKVKDAYIVKPATGRYAHDFGNAAVRAAKKTRFTPKTIDGEPAPTNGFTRRYRFEMGG